MEKLLAEQLVLAERLEFVEIRDGGLESVILRGRLYCPHDLVIAVRTRLAVRRGRHNRYEVRALAYAYHGWIRNTKRHVVRYDNAHDDLPPHRHGFDLRTGDEIAIDYYQNIEDFPTLDEVIREAVELAGRIAQRGERRSR